MSTYQQWRDETIQQLTTKGMRLSVVQQLLRSAQTYKRLAERECNGTDWQTDNLVACPNTGKAMEWCPECSETNGEHGRVTRSQLRMTRLEQRVAKLMPEGFTAEWSGDPRGAVLHVNGISIATRY